MLTRHAPVPPPVADGRRRTLLRLVRITAVVARHSVAGAAEAAVACVAADRVGGHRPSLCAAIRVRRALEDLGPTFVKLGQLLSTRADLMPEALRAELARLRDQVAALPEGAVTAELEAVYGRPLDAVFATFRREPVAAGSMSQIHAATLPDGRRVAVKVRRPGIASVVDTDLALLAGAARTASRLLEAARCCDVVGVAAELGAMVRRELDFDAEAHNAGEICHLFAADPTVVVPEVVVRLSGPSVLVMDFVEGVSLGDHAALAAAGHCPQALAASVIKANLTMMLGPSRFHADPHPGNFLALPGDRLAILDFGATGATNQVTTAALMQLAGAIAGANPDGLRDGVLRITVASRALDHDLLRRQLEELLAPLSTASLDTVEVGPLLRDLLSVLRGHGLRFDGDVALLLKAVIECESTAQELDPAICLPSVLVPFLATRSLTPVAALAA